jgi:hypothetical protein
MTYQLICGNHLSKPKANETILSRTQVNIYTCLSCSLSTPVANKQAIEDYLLGCLVAPPFQV